MPGQLNATLYTQVGARRCEEEIADTPFQQDLQIINGRLAVSFTAQAQIANIQWTYGSSTYSYCGTLANVGDPITISGVGTCATSDIHELCDQQFQLTVNGATSGNLMRVHSSYVGGSAGMLTNRFFIKPGTDIAAVPFGYWDASGFFRTVYNIGPDSIATYYLNGTDGPGQESFMDASVGVVQGYAGLVLGGLGNTAGGGLGDNGLEANTAVAMGDIIGMGVPQSGFP